MKVAILAGGLGTRFAEETRVRPKAMIEIGGKPILWHVMKHFDRYGMKEFVLALGYKKEAIIQYFIDMHFLSGSLTVSTGDGRITVHNSKGCPDWRVHLIDTGPSTMTGGRVKRLAPYIGNETFMLTWCDGLSDVNLDALIAFHRSHRKHATVTAVRPPSRFGYVHLDGIDVSGFVEKPAKAEGWINGAFFVLEPRIFDYIEGDKTVWEKEPMERLARDGEFAAYQHESFWQCMDTLQEQQALQHLWESGKAPWKTWE